MNMNPKKINLNHSLIFFLFCNIFSLILFKFDNFILSPLFCLFLILIIGVSHGSLDHVKGGKLLKIFKIKNKQNNGDNIKLLNLNSIKEKMLQNKKKIKE